jgi:protein SCO1/2
MLSLSAWAGAGDEAIANSAGVDEHLGDKIDLNLKVQNHFGDHISMGDLFKEGKPAIFTLNYYSCASLCSVQLNAVLNGLRDMDWVPGTQFKMLTLSIDPEETSSLAAQKRGTYLEELGKENASWEFMVGKQQVITDIANQVGYRYTYDEVSKQFAHPAVIMILSPDGTISRYLYGVSYSARDLKFALIEASEGKVGTTVDKVILSCFSYDNSTGRYTASAFGLMRLAGVVTMFFLGAMVTFLWRREKRQTQQVSE